MSLVWLLAEPDVFVIRVPGFAAVPCRSSYLNSDETVEMLSYVLKIFQSRFVCPQAGLSALDNVKQWQTESLAGNCNHCIVVKRNCKDDLSLVPLLDFLMSQLLKTITPTSEGLLWSVQILDLSRQHQMKQQLRQRCSHCFGTEWNYCASSLCPLPFHSSWQKIDSSEAIPKTAGSDTW